MTYYRVLFIICLLLLAGCIGQTTLHGVIQLHENAKERNLSRKDKKTGESYAILKVKKHNGKAKTENLIASYSILKDNKVVDKGKTDANGGFEVMDLDAGVYLFRAKVMKLLKVDTILKVSGRRKQKAIIYLNDNLLNGYIDSVILAKDSILLAQYPYNRLVAEQDVANGNARILRVGFVRYRASLYDSVTSVYGFKYYQAAACTVQQYELKAIKSYNDAIYEHLDSINSEGWEEHLENSLKAVEFEYLKRRIKKK